MSVISMDSLEKKVKVDKNSPLSGDSFSDLLYNKDNVIEIMENGMQDTYDFDFNTDKKGEYIHIQVGRLRIPLSEMAKKEKDIRHNPKKGTWLTEVNGVRLRFRFFKKVYI